MTHLQTARSVLSAARSSRLCASRRSHSWSHCAPRVEIVHEVVHNVP